MFDSELYAGLEWQALDECKEKIDPTIHVVKERGKIYFNINIDQFKKVFINIIILFLFIYFLFLNNKNKRKTILSPLFNSGRGDSLKWRKTKERNN